MTTIKAPPVEISLISHEIDKSQNTRPLTKPHLNELRGVEYRAIDIKGTNAIQASSDHSMGGNAKARSAPAPTAPVTRKKEGSNLNDMPLCLVPQSA